MRKHDSIDLLKLYSNTDMSAWNCFLTICYEKHDISLLVKTRYGLQAGMTDLVKKKLNTEKMIQFFLRLEKSIENTMKKIVREKDPNPCDNPLIASANLEFKSQKNDRDHDLELYLKKSGY